MGTVPWSTSEGEHDGVKWFRRRSKRSKTHLKVMPLQRTYLTNFRAWRVGTKLVLDLNDSAKDFMSRYLSVWRADPPQNGRSEVSQLIFDSDIEEVPLVCGHAKFPRGFEVALTEFCVGDEGCIEPKSQAARTQSSTAPAVGAYRTGDFRWPSIQLSERQLLRFDFIVFRIENEEKYWELSAEKLTRYISKINETAVALFNGKRIKGAADLPSCRRLFASLYQFKRVAQICEVGLPNSPRKKHKFTPEEQIKFALLQSKAHNNIASCQLRLRLIDQAATTSDLAIKLIESDLLESVRNRVDLQQIHIKALLQRCSARRQQLRFEYAHRDHQQAVSLLEQIDECPRRVQLLENARFQFRRLTQREKQHTRALVEQARKHSLKAQKRKKQVSQAGETEAENKKQIAFWWFPWQSLVQLVRRCRRPAS